MARSILFWLAVLAGCNTAGPGFRGVAPVRVEARGDTFLLRVAGNRVEALRVNPRPFPTFPPVALAAAEATARATGCVPAWIVGDPSAMQLGLSCAGAKPPTPPRGTPILFCEVWDTSYSQSSRAGSGMLSCSPG